jgi:hemoglobin-like flavoprotein
MRRPGAAHSVGDLSPEQLDAVEDSLARIGPRLDDLAGRFYVRLFDLDPNLRGLFPADLASQQAKFSAHLRLVIMAIRDYDEFLAQAAGIAAMHRGRAVGAEGFRVAGTALLAALSDVFAGHWTDGLAEAWQRAYELAAEAVLAAMSTSR